MTASLTDADKHAFLRDGLIVKRGAVAPARTTAARVLIDSWCRTSMDTGLLTRYTQRTFAPELGGHPDLLALFHHSGAAQLASELCGDYLPVTTVQIQIRLPEQHLAQAQPVKPMHVDGVACPHLDPDELRTFSLLVGVVLSDVSDPAGGALHYQPGGHLEMSRWFRTQWTAGITGQVPPHLDARAGTPFLGRPGDLLLMHHLVPHAVGTNTTTQPRVMAYFRISHVGHPAHRVRSLQDPWLDYPPLSALQPAQ
jgi:hypothetical protein